MQPCLFESPEGAKSNLQFSLLGITVGLGWSQWTPDSLLIRQDDDNVRELNIDTEEEGLPQSKSSTILQSCFSFLHHWSLGGGAAIYKGEWVGGMGLADTEAQEISQGKLKEPIFQQIIFLMISLQFIGEGPRECLGREPGKTFPWEGREIVGGIFFHDLC